MKNESKIITYRTVSREIGCHVNVAKNILLRHFEANPSLAATYLLTGPLLSTSVLTQTVFQNGTASKDGKSLRDLGDGMVKIVDMDQNPDAGDSDVEGLESQSQGQSKAQRTGLMGTDDDDERMDGVGNDRGAQVGEGGIGGGKRFGESGLQREKVKRWGVILATAEALEVKVCWTCGVHFWLKLTKLYQDPAQFLIASLELHDNANMYNSETYGSITGDAFKPSAKPNPLAPAKPSVKESAAPSIFARGSKDKTVKEETRKEVKKQVSTTNVEDEPVKVRAQFLYEWQEYGVLIIEKPRSSTSATAAATAINKAQPLNKSNSKKRIINSDTEEDEPSPAKPKASTSMSKGGSSKTALEPTSSMVAREDKAALEAMADMDVDFSDDEKSVAARPKAKEETKPLRKSATGRKVRRVKKTKREKDDKGYFVSKDYWTDESYSGESEPEQVEPQSKPQRAGKMGGNKPPIKARESASSVGSGSGSGAGAGGGAKKSAGKPAGGQSTLMGFFKKK
ncbi:DNA polymerase delta subunit 3 [Cryptococcus deuterogattii 99/473]|uniref:DNA polymerase delta subunit 3 n=1 Tax=Cryptococcus deuterogattii Ram5 TaxID=1296110 RepID=A0A0D0V9R9_9TREE|nr:DNA polymerase delta subunit 3 [Cryptococcus deuterogattii Ram5]KIY57008.1 DNA polymerase delta subunit 3 [Cryptococcus deuterogattii 99/473]